MPELTKAKLILSETAPTNTIELIQRLAVREPDIIPARARVILESVGMNASSTMCSTIISDTRKLLRYLERKRLLSDDFEVRRKRLSSDFEEIAPRKRRRRE